MTFGQIKITIITHKFSHNTIKEMQEQYRGSDGQVNET